MELKRLHAEIEGRLTRLAAPDRSNAAEWAKRKAHNLGVVQFQASVDGCVCRFESSQGAKNFSELAERTGYFSSCQVQGSTCICQFK